jgi:hypothetical protein
MNGIRLQCSDCKNGPQAHWLHPLHCTLQVLPKKNSHAARHTKPGLGQEAWQIFILHIADTVRRRDVSDQFFSGYIYQSSELAFPF